MKKNYHKRSWHWEERKKIIHCARVFFTFCFQPDELLIMSVTLVFFSPLVEFVRCLSLRCITSLVGLTFEPGGGGVKIFILYFPCIFFHFIRWQWWLIWDLLRLHCCNFILRRTSLTRVQGEVAFRWGTSRKHFKHLTLNHRWSQRGTISLRLKMFALGKITLFCFVDKLYSGPLPCGR